MSAAARAARARLDEDLRRTTARLASLRADHRGFVEASRDSNADDEHDPEGATIAFERSQVEALVRQAEERLGEIAAALDRMDHESYGTCVACGLPIPSERLAVRPTATTCVGCA